MQIKLLLTSIFGVLFLFWAGVRTYDAISFDIHCGDYLKRAADSNSIELAEQNLVVVVDYAEHHDLTSGNTGIFWSSPTNDVGFWYTNVKSSLTELQKVGQKKDATDLERSNVLMKLEKTMLDQGRDSSGVVVPAGISIFPNNIAFFWWGVLSFVLFAVFGIWSGISAIDRF